MLSSKAIQLCMHTYYYIYSFSCSFPLWFFFLKDSVTQNYKEGFFKIFIYLFLAMLGHHRSTGFSLAVVYRLLIAVASRCGGPSWCGAQPLGNTGFSSCPKVGWVVAVPRFKSTGSLVVAHRLNWSVVCGILPDQGLNLCLLHWQQILYHWATRETLHYDLSQEFLFVCFGHVVWHAVGSNPRPLHWEFGVSTTGHPEKSLSQDIELSSLCYIVRPCCL